MSELIEFVGGPWNGRIEERDSKPTSYVIPMQQAGTPARVVDDEYKFVPPHRRPPPEFKFGHYYPAEDSPAGGPLWYVWQEP